MSVHVGRKARIARKSPNLPGGQSEIINESPSTRETHRLGNIAGEEETGKTRQGHNGNFLRWVGSTTRQDASEGEGEGEVCTRARG